MATATKTAMKYGIMAYMAARDELQNQEQAMRIGARAIMGSTYGKFLDGMSWEDSMSWARVELTRALVMTGLIQFKVQVPG